MIVKKQKIKLVGWTMLRMTLVSNLQLLENTV